MGYEKTCKLLLEYGTLAPSFYNSQPWKFALDPRQGVLEVYADRERARSQALDPQGRDLHLDLGFCLEIMVLAASALGYEATETLFPESEKPDGPVARLTLRPLPEALPAGLFSAIGVRHTHAGPYQEGTVQPIHLDRLRNLPPFSGQEKIHFLTEDIQRRRLQEFLHDLSHQGAQNKDLIEEGARWITSLKAPAEGLPLGSLGLPISVKARFALFRYFHYGREIREVARQALLRQGHGIEAPAFLVMTTRTPRPKGFLNAGRWHARLALTLSEMELGAQALYLPVTLDSGRAFLREILSLEAGEEPVLLLRFGKPRSPAWPRTSRRSVKEMPVP